MTIIFSLFGLVLVIVDYEIDLYLNGYAGIVNLHDSHKNPKSLIRKAIWDREHKPDTRFLKIINVIQSVLCVTLLCIRQRMKQTWNNTHVRKELYVEYIGNRPSEFTMLEPVYEKK